jgi:hypothetical protein
MARKQIDRIVVALQAENDELERKLRESQASLKKYAETADNANKRAASSFGYSDVATRKSAKSMDDMSYRVTNFSRQMQDATVQLQAGTDAFTVIAQQGSQLAEVLGRNGPLIGGVIAIAAAVGGTLWKAFDAAGAKADELREKLEGVYAGTLTAQLIETNDAIKQQEADLASLKEEAGETYTETLRLYDAAQKMDGLAYKGTMSRLKGVREDYNELRDAIDKANVTLQELYKTRDKLEGKDDDALGRRAEAIREAGLTELQAEREKHEQSIADLIAYGRTAEGKTKDINALILAETVRHENEMQRIIAASEEKKVKLRTSDAHEKALAAQMRREAQLRSKWAGEVIRDGERHLKDLETQKAKEIAAREQWAEEAIKDGERHAKELAEAEKARLKEQRDLLLEYDPVARETAIHEARMALLTSANAEILGLNVSLNEALLAEERRHQMAMGEARVAAFEAQGEYIDALLEDYQNQSANAAAVFEGVMADSIGTLIEGTSDAFAQMLVQGEDMRKLMESLGKTILTSVISAITQQLMQEAALHFFKVSATKKELATELAADKARQTAAAASLVAATAAAKVSGAAIAAAYAPAAAMASLASFGGNSGPAMAGITATTSLAVSQASLAGMAHDGIDSIPSEGTWLLDKGERVFSASQNERITRAMESGGVGGADNGEVVALLRQIAATQPIVFNGPGWDMDQIFEKFKGFINTGDRVLISRKSRNGKELAA